MAGAVVFKAIKPPRMKDENFRLAIYDAMFVSGEWAKKEFEKTTKTWSKKPKFEVMMSRAGGDMQVGVFTDDEIYNYVNGGTKPHLIFAGIYTGKSNKKALRFRGSYYAKTFPGVINSVGGGSFGAWQHRPYVQHPGTKPRNFDTAIFKLWQPRYKRALEEAMKVWAKSTGQYIGG